MDAWTGGLLHLAVSLVENGQEHIHQKEEGEDDVAEIQHGAHDAIRIGHSVEVEISQQSA